jgi:BolA protein
MGEIADRIRDKLTAAFAPETLEVVDESWRHAGHVGAGDGSGETHFDVKITASAFAGMGRVQRQRAVNDVLREELAGPVHALSIKADAPLRSGGAVSEAD